MDSSSFSGLVMLLSVFLFSCVVAHLDRGFVGGTTGAKPSKSEFPEKNGSRSADLKEAMQMDGVHDSIPIAPVCGANVNCAFIVYDEEDNVLNRIFYCGECVAGHQCTFFFNDQSQSMLIYRCLPTEVSTEGTDSSERAGRKVGETTWSRVLNLTKQAVRKEAFKLGSRQGLIADIHEL